MNYIVKDLKLEKIHNNFYSASIKIYDLVNITITITTYEDVMGFNKWCVSFVSNNDYKGFNVSSIPGQTSNTKFGFESFESAEAWAKEYYMSKMNILISCVLADIDDYIESIGENI